MIYPATYDIEILQNSTWKVQFRATQNRKQVEDIAITSGEPTFTVSCHGLSAGNKVVFTGATVCGVDEDVVYYVISGGLSTSAFKVSATLSGSSVQISKFPNGALYVARPIDLTGYIVDADIKETVGYTQVATMSGALTVPSEGLAELSLTPSGTLAIASGIYAYDVSLTSPGNERYYWLTGQATVVRTISRN